MTRKKRRTQQDMPQQQMLFSPQQYDNALKGLMKDHAAEILNELIPGAELIREENNEIKRENMRADLVYAVREGGKRKIVNLELQTTTDPDIALRMLKYNFELYSLHRIPNQVGCSVSL